MKKIKKEIQETHAIEVFVAYDDTEFNSENECRKYENSAAGVLLNKLEAITLKKDMTLNIDGNDENKYSTVVPTEQEHLDTINQLVQLFHWGNDNDAKTFVTEKDLHTLILVGRRFEDGTLDWVWFYKLNDFVMNVTGGKYVVMEKP